MNFVASDLGASSTRYITDQGKIQLLPNNLVMLPYGTVTKLEKNVEDIEGNLEVTIEKEGNESSYFPVTFLAGKMAERYSSNFVTPDINKHKHKQPINYISAVLSAAVAKIKFGLDNELISVIAVPPVEINNAKQVFKQELVGKYKVTFPKYMDGVAVEFTIADVMVYEESVLAMASFFFNMNGTPKEDHRDFMRGRVLSLDIGASTSDAAIIEDGRFLERSGRTIKTGGNVARSTFINLITEQEGYNLPESDAEKAIAEGRIVEGNGYKDVSDLVNQSKKELAHQLITPLTKYFGEVGIPIQQIRAIVVSGGGSMPGQYTNDDGEVVITSEPLSKHVTEALRDICPGVLTVPYGEDARFANVKGLFIRSKMLMAKLSATRNNQTVKTAPVAPVAPAMPVI